MPTEVYDGRNTDHGDEAYLNWMGTHQGRYVVNTRRNIDPDYMPLHRPTPEHHRRTAPGRCLYGLLRH